MGFRAGIVVAAPEAAAVHSFTVGEIEALVSRAADRESVRSAPKIGTGGKWTNRERSLWAVG